MRILLGILGIAIFVVIIVGYVLNIIAIANTTAFSGMLILRAIGVFLGPLGVVLGFV